MDKYNKTAEDFCKHYNLKHMHYPSILSYLIENNNKYIYFAELIESIEMKYDIFVIPMICEMTINELSHIFNLDIYLRYSDNIEVGVRSDFEKSLKSILKFEKFSLKYVVNSRLKFMVMTFLNKFSLFSEKRSTMFKSYLQLLKDNSVVQFNDIYNLSKEDEGKSLKLQAFKNLIKKLSFETDLDIICEKKSGNHVILSRNHNFSNMIKYIQVFNTFQEIHEFIRELLIDTKKTPEQIRELVAKFIKNKPFHEMQQLRSDLSDFDRDTLDKIFDKSDNSSDSRSQIEEMKIPTNIDKTLKPHIEDYLKILKLYNPVRSSMLTSMIILSIMNRINSFNDIRNYSKKNYNEEFSSGAFNKLIKNLNKMQNDYLILIERDIYSIDSVEVFMKSVSSLIMITDEKLSEFDLERDNFILSSYDRLNEKYRKQIDFLFNLAAINMDVMTNGLISVYIARLLIYQGIFDESMIDKFHRIINIYFEKADIENILFFQLLLYSEIKLESMIEYSGYNKSFDKYTNFEYLGEYDYLSEIEISISIFELYCNINMKVALTYWNNAISDRFYELDENQKINFLLMVVNKLAKFYHLYKKSIDDNILARMLDRIIEYITKDSFHIDIFVDILFSFFYLRPQVFVSRNNTDQILKIFKASLMSEIKVHDLSIYEIFMSKLEIVSPYSNYLIEFPTINHMLGFEDGYQILCMINTARNKKTVERKKRIENITIKIMKEIINKNNKISIIQTLLYHSKNHSDKFFLDEISKLIIGSSVSFTYFNAISELMNLYVKRGISIPPKLISLVFTVLNNKWREFDTNPDLNASLHQSLSAIIYAIKNENIDKSLKLLKIIDVFINNIFKKNDLNNKEARIFRAYLVRRSLILLIHDEIDSEIGYNISGGNYV